MIASISLYGFPFGNDGTGASSLPHACAGPNACVTGALSAHPLRPICPDPLGCEGHDLCKARGEDIACWEGR